MSFAPTAQQAAFLRALTTTASHLALVARAGCGKTSTILLGVAELVKINPRIEILVAAYNKAIAQEVSGKLKALGVDWKQAEAKTLHALGFSLAGRAFNARIDEKKVKNLIAERNDEVFNSYGPAIESLVRYAKQAGFGFFPDQPVGSVSAWADLADNFDVNGFEDTSDLEPVIEAAQAIYRASLAQTEVMDFDDMILFPLIKNLRVRFGKDVIFLDEAQDLSRTRQALAKKFLKPVTGRLVIVGDDRQAIYGFSGADAAALDNLTKSMGAVVLPLSVTWRCPKAVVTLAQTIVPDIEAAPSAPDGVVNAVTKDVALAGVGPRDAILCRNTKPLIQYAYALLKMGKACKVEGKEIGAGLVALSRRWRVSTTSALATKVEDYREREWQKALAKGDENKAEAVMDKCDALLECIKAVNDRGDTSVSGLQDFITTMFSDDVTGVTTLATYHRSKGREWPHVFLIEHSQRCPSKAAKLDWQIHQEHNLAYVAFTRAQAELTFIE